jgi:Txe/YoeB family toxin of Txe-Axe toxin-antitoxin module
MTDAELTNHLNSLLRQQQQTEGLEKVEELKRVYKLAMSRRLLNAEQQAMYAAIQA